MRSINISWKDYLFPPLHPEGNLFVALFSVGALILTWLWWPLFAVGLGLTIWCFYFFRNPARISSEEEGVMVSPADGVVQMLGEVTPPEELGMGTHPVERISIFMSVFDCHVNRAPIAGKVAQVTYIPGKFFNATLDKASHDNERRLMSLEIKGGQKVGVVQIAGLVARRIVPESNVGDDLKTGQVFGMIRFGSRVDVYLPQGVKPKVLLGQKMIAGETVIAYL